MLDCLTSMHKAARLGFLYSLTSQLYSISSSSHQRIKSSQSRKDGPFESTAFARRTSSSALVSTILSSGLFQLSSIELWRNKAVILNCVFFNMLPVDANLCEHCLLNGV